MQVSGGWQLSYAAAQLQLLRRKASVHVIEDAIRSKAVAVRILSCSYRFILCAVAHQLLNSVLDVFFLRADEDGRAGFDCFGSFRFLSQYNDWFLERWRFLLNAARVCEYQVCSIHQI